MPKIKYASSRKDYKSPGASQNLHTKMLCYFNKKRMTCTIWQLTCSSSVILERDKLYKCHGHFIKKEKVKLYLKRKALCQVKFSGYLVRKCTLNMEINSNSNLASPIVKNRDVLRKYSQLNCCISTYSFLQFSGYENYLLGRQKI
jgi:hypothetical protein